MTKVHTSLIQAMAQLLSVTWPARLRWRQETHLEYTRTADRTTILASLLCELAPPHRRPPRSRSYVLSSDSGLLRAHLTLRTSRSLERGRPSLRIRRGPFCFECTSKNLSTAETGEINAPVLPKNSLTPLPKGSVLAFHSRTFSTEGDEWDTSAKVIAGADPPVAVNSPALKKPEAACSP